ncbi:hypothetical protein O9993_22710 [Vibrio lentus]|nr:hypothetical protein [Vibrio lentus]
MNSAGIPVSRWVDGVLENKDNIHVSAKTSVPCSTQGSRGELSDSLVLR